MNQCPLSDFIGSDTSVDWCVPLNLVPVPRFFTWFDHQSWYPLGRPVATTIYPGMQITAVGLWRLLQERSR